MRFLYDEMQPARYKYSYRYLHRCNHHHTTDGLDGTQVILDVPRETHQQADCDA